MKFKFNPNIFLILLYDLSINEIHKNRILDNNLRQRILLRWGGEESGRFKKKKKEKSIAIGREKNGLTACYDIFIALKRSENCPFSSACDGEGKADGSLNLDQERGGEMG